MNFKSNKGSFKKGNIPWNKGIKGMSGGWNKGISQPIEKRKQISETLKRKYASGEIVHPMLGKHHSLQTIDKIKDTFFKKGSTPHNKGKTLSIETKNKIKKARLLQVFSKESQFKKSQTLKQLWKNPQSKFHSLERKQKLSLKAKESSKYRKGSFESSIEKKIQNFLFQLNINFIKHKYINIKHGYQCDIYIPEKNLVIECDGDYWHNLPRLKELDKIRNRELEEAGYKILRLKESEIRQMNLDAFKNKFRDDFLWAHGQ